MLVSLFTTGMANGQRSWCGSQQLQPGFSRLLATVYLLSKGLSVRKRRDSCVDEHERGITSINQRHSARETAPKMVLTSRQPYQLR
ncbi:uncharacterized protein YALI1_A16496g [Yarrowia lipolytica]|uniref:Uncharacterized protein n=1 Tax=Yarrowia lipolytica TaxID=4952 RepID=A0A1D8N528_YARLL|nr:hypothetical protein YALI1_A16496g [Yarrowia lipolytica]